MRRLNRHSARVVRSLDQHADSGVGGKVVGCAQLWKEDPESAVIIERLWWNRRQHARPLLPVRLVTAAARKRQARQRLPSELAEDAFAVLPVVERAGVERRCGEIDELIEGQALVGDADD